MNQTTPLVLLALLAGLLPACSSPEPVGEAASPIIGGTVDPGDPAVVLLISYPADKKSFDTCTAELIAPMVLLTAAHCLDPANHAGYTFGVFPGPDASAYPTASALAPKLLAVKSVQMHPDYDPAPPFHADIGVVLLEEPLDITPLPILRSAPDQAIVGGPARIVGYGQTKYKEFNVSKHEATTVVVSIGDDDTIVVGDGTHRSCVGDSGGPALVKQDGVELIAGVDSYTETTGCLEPASYRRTDVYTAFLDMYAPPPPVMDAGTGSTTSSSTGGGSDPPASGGCATAPLSGSGVAPFAALVLGALTALRRRKERFQALLRRAFSRIALALAAMTLGCGGVSRAQLLDLHVSGHVYHHPQTEVIEAATQLLEAQGFRIKSFSGGMLRTEWRAILDDEEFATAYDRYVIQIKRLTPEHCRVQAVKLTYASVGMETYHPTSSYKGDGSGRNVNNVTNGKGWQGLPMGKPGYGRDVDFEWQLLRKVEPERARLLEGTVDWELKRAGR